MMKQTIMHYAKTFLHIIGYVTLIGMAFTTCLMFYSMLTYGYFRALEPDTPLLYFEMAISIYGVAFLLYLVFKYAQTIWKEQVKLQLQ